MGCSQPTPPAPTHATMINHPRRTNFRDSLLDGHQGCLPKWIIHEGDVPSPPYGYDRHITSEWWRRTITLWVLQERPFKPLTWNLSSGHDGARTRDLHSVIMKPGSIVTIRDTKDQVRPLSTRPICRELPAFVPRRPTELAVSRSVATVGASRNRASCTPGQIATPPQPWTPAAFDTSPRYRTPALRAVIQAIADVLDKGG